MGVGEKPFAALSEPILSYSQGMISLINIDFVTGACSRQFNHDNLHEYQTYSIFKILTINKKKVIYAVKFN